MATKFSLKSVVNSAMFNIYISALVCSFFSILHFVQVSGQVTLVPLCSSDLYDIEILKEATYWRAPVAGGCYDTYENQTVPCDFYFSFCKSLPSTLTGGVTTAGAVQNETVGAPLILGGLSTIVDDTSGSQLIVGFSGGGGEVGCGTMKGILMILQCDPNQKWALNTDGSGVIPIPIVVNLYDTPESCSYNMTVRYDGACTKIGPPISVSGGLSPGSILIIIFLCTVTVYLIGGVIMNCSAGATGLEMLPNLEFWKSLPGLIADGAFFFWSCATCNPDGGGDHNKTSYESI